MSNGLTVPVKYLRYEQRTLSQSVSTFYFPLTVSSATVTLIQKYHLKSFLHELSASLYSNCKLHSRIHAVAFQRPLHSDHPIAIEKCERTHSRNPTFDVDALHIPPCEIRRLFYDQPHSLPAVVGEPHRLHVYGATDVSICDRSTRRLRLVIYHHNGVGNHICAMFQDAVAWKRVESWRPEK